MVDSNLRKIIAIIPIFLTFVLAFSIFGNASAQPSTSYYIVTEYGSGELSKVTPGGTISLITGGLSGPVGVTIVPETNPVGGIYAPTDRLSILTPYIALVGLIGAISIIFTKRRLK